MRTPELAAAVTLQPLRRFALDAAIVFSDILVVPEAMGQGYRFRDEGGIAMEYRVATADQVEKLSPTGIRERLAYVGATLRALRRELGDRKALLGFGGSPWTIACYMIEGGAADDFARIKRILYAERAMFDTLLEKITTALIDFFRLQIEAGVDAVQIFDSWGGVIAGADYEAASLQWIRRVIAALPAGFPVIVFGRGTAPHLAAQAAAGARVLSVDWTVDLAAAHADLAQNPKLKTQNRPIALQGNLDPVLLATNPEIVRRETARLLESMRGRPGYIFNLGHGITPDARLDCVATLVETVTSWK